MRLSLVRPGHWYQLTDNSVGLCLDVPSCYPPSAKLYVAGTGAQYVTARTIAGEIDDQAALDMVNQQDRNLAYAALRRIRGCA